MLLDGSLPREGRAHSLKSSLGGDKPGRKDVIALHG